MTGGGDGGPTPQPCLFLLFPQGRRPAALAARTALAACPAAHISHDPAARDAADSSSNWLEVVVDGLTFDLLGLSPGQGLQVPPPRHSFGLAAASFDGREAIGLAPGPHLAGSASAMPVVRTLLRLAAGLSAQWEESIGALWRPAASAMRRDLFVAVIDDWLAGAAFPALGLSGVTERAGGLLASDGLAFFTGQELVLDAGLSADRPAATRLLVRLIDHLVEQAPVQGERTVSLADGGQLTLAGAGPVIEVSRG